ncbi:MAG: NAD(P)/FAD-dependent oxidoreductase [bacterium]
MENTVIIGNGPAGLTAYLGLEDGNPLLVSPEVKPDPSVCGGVLTPPAISCFKRFDKLPSPLNGFSHEIKTVRVLHNRTTLAETSPDAQLLAFDRTKFDNWLFSQVKNQTTLRHKQGYVRSIESTPRGLTLQLRGGESIRTRGIIDASGHRGITGEDSAHHSNPLIGLEWSWGNDITPLNNKLLIILYKNGYCGITSNAGGDGTISAVIRKNPTRNQPIDLARRRIIEQLPEFLSPLESKLTSNNPSTKAGFSRTHPRPVRRRMVAVGDASGFTMPLSGEGIGMAVREGFEAGSYLSQVNTPWPLTKRNQQQLHERLVIPYRRQIPRWWFTHWLGMNGHLLTLIPSQNELLTTLLNNLIPGSHQWKNGEM